MILSNPEELNESIAGRLRSPQTHPGKHKVDAINLLLGSKATRAGGPKESQMKFEVFGVSAWARQGS